MVYNPGETSARLSFILPESITNTQTLLNLLDGLAYQAGKWGAFGLLAVLEEHNSLFEIFRQAGFSVYAWQRVWQLAPPEENNKTRSSHWQTAASVDEIPIHNLYHSLVPSLVQSAESFALHNLQGLVYRQEGEILAYIDDIYGPSGIYLQPLIHPAADSIVELLKDILNHLPSLLGRPVYMTVRSYQAWLEMHLEELQWRAAPRQALLVKHLTIAQRATLQNERLSMIENRRAEPTTPIVHNLARSSNHQSANSGH